MSRAADPAGPLRHGATAALPPLGTRLKGRYELMRIIGRGGMSTIYQALDHMRLRGRAAHPHVALKLASMPPPYASAVHELIHREAQRMQGLHHPNIVRVFDSDCDRDCHFMVMELLAGRTLAAAMPGPEGKRLDWNHIRHIVGGIGAALSHAHAHGVVHTDLKPANIFLCADGGVKVLDFGLSQRAGSRAGAGPEAPDEDATVLYLDMVGGLTPAFASPERLEGADPTPGCDLFAFGLIVYILLAGTHPFQRRSALEAWAMGLEPERPEGLDGRRWQALRALMAFDPADRPTSVDAFTTRFLGAPWRPRTLLRRLMGEDET